MTLDDVLTLLDRVATEFTAGDVVPAPQDPTDDEEVAAVAAEVEDLAAVWLRQLSGYSLEEGTVALDTLTSTTKWQPALADIIGMLDRFRAAGGVTLSARKAWRQLTQAISRYAKQRHRPEDAAFDIEFEETADGVTILRTRNDNPHWTDGVHPEVLRFIDDNGGPGIVAENLHNGFLKRDFTLDWTEYLDEQTTREKVSRSVAGRYAVADEGVPDRHGIEPESLVKIPAQLNPATTRGALGSG